MPVTQQRLFGGRVLPPTGRDLATKGIAKVRTHNEDFVEIMRRFAKRFAKKRPVSIDELRIVAALQDIRPAHPNAWGAIFKEAGWECVGYKKSSYTSNHARLIRVWRWEGEK